MNSSYLKPIAGTVGILAVVGIVIYLGVTSGWNTTKPAVEITAPEVSASDWKIGNPSAKVTLIEYGDFQCPVCKQYEPILQQVKKDYGDRILFIYRYFPLKNTHPQALLTTQAAEAAGRQGKFWEMHDMLFDRQTDWAGKSDAENIIVHYATTLGLDMAKFKSDLHATDVEIKASKSFNDAIALGLNGTPSFFINGKKISNPQSYDAFKKLLDAELNK